MRGGLGHPGPGPCGFTGSRGVAEGVWDGCSLRCSLCPVGAGASRSPPVPAPVLAVPCLGVGAEFSLGNGSTDGRRVNERKVGETDGKEGRETHESSPFTCLKAYLLIE